MRGGAGRAIAVALAGLALAAAAPAFAQARAAAAEVAVGPDPQDRAVTTVAAQIEIAAPPAALWSVMMDCAGAARIVPNLKSCRILDAARDGESDVREHVVSYFGIRARNVFRSRYQPLQSIAFSRTEGDMRVMEGEWRIDPLREGRASRLSYRARLAISAPVPLGMVRNAMKADTRKILEAVQREAERQAN